MAAAQSQQSVSESISLYTNYVIQSMGFCFPAKKGLLAEVYKTKRERTESYEKPPNLSNACISAPKTKTFGTLCTLQENYSFLHFFLHNNSITAQKPICTFNFC